MMPQYAAMNKKRKNVEMETETNILFNNVKLSLKKRKFPFVDIKP